MGTTSLSDEERAELEQLRAEKAEREELERLRAERAERAQAARGAAERADASEARRVAQARARGRRLMEPGDDLSMPLGQKVVLAGIAVVVALIVALFLIGPK